MCGINLYFGRDKKIIRRMNDDLSHRGLRSTVVRYFESDFPVQLGHIRLPIQGLSESYDHPFSFKNKFDVAMVGEILNFRSFDAKAKTDIEVVADRWAESNRASLYHYEGFWSMVFINHNRHDVTVVTDPLNKKPLYYRHGEHPGISSEIKPLLRIGPATVDETYMAGVMKWGYCHDGSTPYNEIKMLQGGMIYTFNDRGDLRFKYPYEYYGKYGSGDIVNILSDAVKDRLVSDVPVCVLLSGGLDSTIIFELMKAHTTDFSIFHVDNDEAEFLNYLDIPGNIPVHPITLPNLNDDLSPVISALKAHQVPVDLGSVVPQYFLGKAIQSKGFHVALSGDGADELYGGYRRAADYDSQGSDIHHELIHYHHPRLDRMMMASTVELRCPFLSRDSLLYAKRIPWSDRQYKERLKDGFCHIVPKQILDRRKLPLKISGIRGDKKMEWRRMMLDLFRKEVLNECK